MTPILTKDGSRLIKSPYRKISVAGRKIDEHRYVMEQALGRKLERHEEVHHKNEDKHDNRIENLEVKPKLEHFEHHRPSFSRSKSWTPAQRKSLSGAKGSAAKLSHDQANEVRIRAAGGESRRSLARAFGLDASSVTRIVNGETYKEAA
jgi:hypothetical protein